MDPLFHLGEGTAGVWTLQAGNRALSRSTVARRMGTNWQSPFPGVLADAGFVLDAVQWAYAGVLASGGEGQPCSAGAPTHDGTLSVRLKAAACGRSACRVWGYRLINDDDPATGAHEMYEHDVHTWSLSEDLAAPVRDGSPAGHVLHRHRLALGAGDLVQHPSGLWLTSPLRTALDACTLLPFEAAVCVMDGALHDERFTRADLEAAIDRWSGRPGVNDMRAVAAAADGRSESGMETLTRLLLSPDWPELEPQVTVYGADTFPVRRYDLGDRDIKLGVEGDGKIAHAGEQMVAKDYRKDRRSAGMGWATERVTWREVRCEPVQTRSRILRTRDQLRARAAA